MINRQSSFRSLDRRSDNIGGRSLTGSDKQSRRRLIMSNSSADYNRDDNQDSDSQDELDQLLGPDPEAELAKLQATAARSHATSRSVTSRLYHDGRRRAQQTQERLVIVREQVLMREMAEMTQKPNITQKARSRPDRGALFANHTQEWLERKAQHREELQREMEQEKMKQVQQSPNIDKRSAQLVERLDDYAGPISGWESHFAKFCAKKTVPLPPQLFHPNINSNAIRLDVEEDIADRLFKDAQTRDQRKKDLIEYVRAEELIDHNTGRPLFSPQSLRGPIYDGESNNSARRRRPEEVAEELLAKGMELENKKKQQAQRMHTDDQELTFSPSINKRSAVLAEQGGRVPLYEPKSASRSARGASAGEASTSSDTKTKLAAKKGRSVSNNQQQADGVAATGAKKGKSPPAYDVNEFVRRSEQAAIARAIRLEQIKQAVEEQQQQECSFQPKISKRSHELFASANIYGVDIRQPSEFDLQQQQLSAAADSTRALRFSESGSRSATQTKTPKSPQHRHVDSSLAGGSGSAAAADLSASLTPRGAAALSAPGGDSHVESPAAAPPAQLPHVEEYISTFERQMFAVLDEWRELEGN